MKANRFVSIAVVIALLFGVCVTGTALAAPNEQRATFTAPVLIVNSSFLNVRTGPGLHYGVLVTVVGGTALPVLAVSEDRTWYQVSTVVGTGWVNSLYTIPRGNFENVPFAAAPAAVDPRAFPVLPAVTYSGAVNTIDDTAVDFGFSTQREFGVSVLIDHPLRTGPSINNPEITYLTSDFSTIFTVIGATFNEGVNWLQVAIPDQTRGSVSGWLEESKVRFRPYACKGTFTAIVFRQDAELKRGPDGTGPNGGVFAAAGAEAYLLDKVLNVYKVELVDGSIGWVEESMISVREEIPSAYCTAGGAAARIPGAGQQVNPIFALPSGVVAASVPRVIVNTGFLNIRSGPGVQFTSVATVPGGTELAVLGIAPDRVWYLVQGSFGQGWLNNEFTLFRGDGRRLPIIRGEYGVVARPTATVTGNVTLYAAPNLTLGIVGTLNGPTVVNVVARTSDFNWVQLETPLGFAWVQREFVTISGDAGLIPVLG